LHGAKINVQGQTALEIYKLFTAL